MGSYVSPGIFLIHALGAALEHFETVAPAESCSALVASIAAGCKAFGAERERLTREHAELEAKTHSDELDRLRHRIVVLEGQTDDLREQLAARGEK